MSLKYSLKLKVLVAQLHLALYNSMYCILLSSSVQGILQTECWSELPFSSPGDPPDPGIEPRSLALQAESLLSEPQGNAYRFLNIKTLEISTLWCAKLWAIKNGNRDFPSSTAVKNPPSNTGNAVQSLVGELKHHMPQVTKPASVTETQCSQNKSK